MAELPKSRVLRARDAAVGTDVDERGPTVPGVSVLEIPVQIKPIHTFNDYIFLIHLPAEAPSIIVKERRMLPEGIVIGVPKIGDGIPDGRGGRLRSQLKIGDHVMFSVPNLVSNITSADGYYEGVDIVAISERHIMAKLADIPFEIVTDKSY